MDIEQANLHPRFLDLTGQQFGRLTVVQFAGKYNGSRNSLWQCVCECGQEAFIPTGRLRDGSSRSCGCLQRELTSQRFRTHDMRNSPTYQGWKSMLQRCCNRSNPAWGRYGGRGIAVCKRWRNSFQSFAQDMGDRPEGTTLDRINNDGDYEPGNCRWATHSEQARNKRNNSLLTIDGVTRCIPEWADISGIHAKTIWSRVNYYGWDDKSAVFKPARQRQPKE